MPLFKKLRKKLYSFLLNRKAEKSDLSHKSMNIDEAKKISILFDAGEKAEADKVIHWAKSLERSGKEINLLGYIPHKLKEYKPPYPFFTKKDINWYFFPKSDEIEQFTNHKSDILCCLFTKENLTLEAIATLSNAQFRVGKFMDDKTHCFDFMINLDEKATSKELIEQINYFLTQIRSKNAAI